MKISFLHKPHPHVEARKESGPIKKGHGITNINGKIAVWLTTIVGTMWCAYAFSILAFVALPDALKQGPLAIVQWISQTFIQLVMLSVIMVGQNILSAASDKRAEMTYEDADATFHEAKEIQSHLQQQDDALNHIIDRMEALEAKLKDKATD